MRKVKLFNCWSWALYDIEVVRENPILIPFNCPNQTRKDVLCGNWCPAFEVDKDVSGHQIVTLNCFPNPGMFEVEESE